MPQSDRDTRLEGRVFLTGGIRVATGLHIGGARSALTTGGLEKAVARDPMTYRPYIPGSSLKGKLRALLEKHYNKSQQWVQYGVRIHVCFTFNEKGEKVADPSAYARCEVCPLFGTPSRFAVVPTRLTVRDVPLDDDSTKRLARARTDLPFTEVKWETALDRVTAAATTRELERVPAGAVFAPLEMLLDVYEEGYVKRLLHLLDAMQLLEDDYLGGMGSRGSGKVVFENLNLTARHRQTYSQKKTFADMPLSLKELMAKEQELMAWLHQNLSL